VRSSRKYQIHESGFSIQYLGFADTFSVSHAIDALGFGKFQIVLSLLTGLCWMTDSMEMMILSILAPALHCQFCINKYQQAFLTNVMERYHLHTMVLWRKLLNFHEFVRLYSWGWCWAHHFGETLVTGMAAGRLYGLPLESFLSMGQLVPSPPITTCCYSSGFSWDLQLVVCHSRKWFLN